MFSNKRKPYFFNISKRHHVLLKKYARRFKIDPLHLIGKIIRKKISDEKNEKTEKS